MPKVPRSVLKEYFQTGDKPTAPQFSTMLDSMVNFTDDRDFIGLRQYNPAVQYLVGDCAVFNNQVVQCIADTTGVFNPAKWSVLAAFGSVNYAGTWDTQNNVPALASSVGTKGFYYVVINASPNPSDNTNLNGIDDWGTGDWAIFNGSVWEKVDNSEAPVEAQFVSFEPTPSIAATNVQDAIEELDSDLTLAINSKVSLSGDTMTGDLILNADPTDSLGAATKSYVDNGDASLQTQINGKVNRSGDTMTGDLILNADPTNVLGAVTKQYVDAINATLTSLANSKVSKSGDTMTGNLILNADPSAALGAATKQYVDAGDTALQTQVTAKVNKAGDTMTGNLILNADPSAALGAATKQYVDASASSLQTQVNDKVSKSGDTMTGLLILSGDPTAGFGAATKRYVDTAAGLKLNLSGGTMTGNLLLNADPTSALGAATKQYVDTGDAAKLNLSGGTMTGFLTLNADPTSNLHAATKQFVDIVTGQKLNLSGGTLSGPLILNANPSNALGAATKQYVDAAVSGVPAQQKVVTIPLTFSTIYTINSGTATTWSRIPLQASIPGASDIFSGTTAISAKIMLDYNSTSAATGMKMAMLNYTDYPGGTIDNTMILAGSSSSLSVSTAFTTVVGPSFTLTNSKSWSVVIQRTGGTINVEGATLIITCS